VCLIGHHHQQKKWQKNIQSGETKNWENTRIERILELSEWLSDESRFVLFLDMRTIIMCSRLIIFSPPTANHHNIIIIFSSLTSIKLLRSMFSFIIPHTLSAFAHSLF
jgi:hypothetical protein